jgi:hypothetical protein
MILMIVLKFLSLQGIMIFMILMTGEFLILSPFGINEHPITINDKKSFYYC